MPNSFQTSSPRTPLKWSSLEDMGKSGRVEGQESFHTTGCPTGYLHSATLIKDMNIYSCYCTWCFGVDVDYHVICRNLYVTIQSLHLIVRHSRFPSISTTVLSNSYAYVSQQASWWVLCRCSWCKILIIRLVDCTTIWYLIFTVEFEFV